VYVAYFRDVQNAGFLHEQLLARNADFEYALIDASIVRCLLLFANSDHMSCWTAAGETNTSLPIDRLAIAAACCRL
jgi:hypothetical protein